MFTTCTEGHEVEVFHTHLDVWEGTCETCGEDVTLDLGDWE